MSRTIVTLVIAALVMFAPGLVEAQDGGGGRAGRASVPVFEAPPSTAVNQTVSLRIYPKTSEEATWFKASLSGQQGVSDLKLSEDLRTLSCTYQGVYGDLPKLETKCSGSLLSPAKVVLALSRNPARAKCKTCGIDEHLRSVGGVSSVAVKGTRAELYADLAQLDLRKMAEAAGSAGYQVELQSHAWWSLKVEGDATKLIDAFADLKGILKIERAGSEARVLALRSLSAEALVTAAQKAGLKATPTLLQ